MELRAKNEHDTPKVDHAGRQWEGPPWAPSPALRVLLGTLSVRSHYSKTYKD